MSSYAVVWQNAEDLSLAGELELTEEAVCLSGGDRRNPTRLVLDYDDILGIERGPKIRIGRSNAITIFHRHAGDLRIASLGGVGLLHEIFTGLEDGLATGPPP